MSEEGSRPMEERPEHLGDAQARLRRRDRALAWALTAGAHVLGLAILLWPRAVPVPPRPTLPPLMVSLFEQPKPEPPGPPAETQAEASRPTPQPVVTARVVVPEQEIVPDNSDLLSDSQLAGAASAGEDGGGGGGGGCDTARAVQQALRRDPLVHAAVHGANRLGKSIMLWNGDWVRTGVQDGKGLSAVREAIMWEVAFSPTACRNQPMHGLVLLSLADGNTRFAIGSGAWRWSDLLGLRGIPPNR